MQKTVTLPACARAAVAAGLKKAGDPDLRRVSEVIEMLPAGEWLRIALPDALRLRCAAALSLATRTAYYAALFESAV